MHRIRHDHRRVDRLKQLRDERLQRMGLHWHRNPEPVGERGGVRPRNNATRLRSDASAGGFDRRDPAAVGGKAGNFAVLDYVDAGVDRAAGETPCHIVMFGDAATWLKGGAEHRITDVRDTLTMGQTSATCWGSSHLASIPLSRLASTRRMLSRTSCSVCEVEHAALAEQDLIAEFVLEALP